MPAFLKAKGPEAKRRAAKRRAKLAAYRQVCAEVDRRDGVACRLCGRMAQAGAHHHHIQYRSRGGKDTTDNLIRICGGCHCDIHAKRIVVTGNANGQLQIEGVA